MAACVGSGVQPTYVVRQRQVSGLAAQSREDSASRLPVRRPTERKLKPSVVVAWSSGGFFGDASHGFSDCSPFLSNSFSKKGSWSSGRPSSPHVFSEEIQCELQLDLQQKPLLERSPSASEWAQLAGSVYYSPSGIEDIRPETGHKVQDNGLPSTSVEELSQIPSKQSASKLKSQELAKRWREIQGESQWKGLLDPLDSVLREEIIKYGDFAQANYDSFDYEPCSKYCGSSRFSKNNLLEKVGLANTGYEVTRYLYAMANVDVPKFFRRSSVADPWSKDSNWMGFIAVATDEEEIKRLGRRDIVISWRGTVMALEWMENLRDYLTPTSPGVNRVVNGCSRSVKVESGFKSLYTSKDEKTRYNKKSAAEQVKEEIQRLVELYADEELSITITGHSLGGALATLSAYDIANSKCNERPASKQNQEGSKLGSVPVTVFSFASPRVGNDAFRDRMEDLGVHVLRTYNLHDVVPKVPGLFVNERCYHLFGNLEELVSPWLDMLPWTYTHVGQEIRLDQTASPFLKTHRDYGASHNLNLCLHLLDGYQGPNLPYKRTIERDIALVNKSCAYLQDDLRVPINWCQQENKGMMRLDDGQWVLPDRPEDEVPSSAAHDQWV